MFGEAYDPILGHSGETRRTFICHRCQAGFSRRSNSLPSSHFNPTNHEDNSDVCKRHVDRCTKPPLCQREEEPIADDNLFVPETLVASLDVSVSPGSSSGSRLTQENMPQRDLIEYVLVRVTVIPLTNKYAYRYTYGLSSESVEQHITAYFRYFHPALPLVHRPTFHVSSAPRLLVNIMSTIGRLYLVPRSPNDENSASFQQTSEFWHEGVAELSQHVSEVTLKSPPEIYHH